MFEILGTRVSFPSQLENVTSLVTRVPHISSIDAITNSGASTFKSFCLIDLNYINIILIYSSSFTAFVLKDFAKIVRARAILAHRELKQIDISFVLRQLSYYDIELYF